MCVSCHICECIIVHICVCDVAHVRVSCHTMSRMCVFRVTLVSHTQKAQRSCHPSGILSRVCVCPVTCVCVCVISHICACAVICVCISCCTYVCVPHQQTHPKAVTCFQVRHFCKNTWVKRDMSKKSRQLVQMGGLRQFTDFFGGWFYILIFPTTNKQKAHTVWAKKEWVEKREIDFEFHVRVLYRVWVCHVAHICVSCHMCLYVMSFICVCPIT